MYRNILTITMLMVFTNGVWAEKTVSESEPQDFNVSTKADFTSSKESGRADKLPEYMENQHAD